MSEIDTNKMVGPDSKASRSWLQRLKEESWEAELLVSTIAIFGTLQLFHLIDWCTNLFIDLLNPNQYFIGHMIVFFGLLAVGILTAMFIIHFFLRAYWVGLVGLNSVFPDYSIEDSAYSEIYTKKILSILPKLKDSIKKVDELCSVIFSVAFTFMFIYGYLAFLSSIYLLLFNLLAQYVTTYILFIPLFCIGIMSVYQMIIMTLANLKAYKKNERIQTSYFKSVKWSSFFLYGPLYKSILQVSMIFGSNFKKKKSMVYLLFTFLFFGIIVVVSQFERTNIPYLMNQKAYFDNTKVNASYYASENEENDFLLSPEITTDIIKTTFVKVFIPVFNHERSIRESTCGEYLKDETKSKEEQKRDRSKYYLNCYHMYNFIYVNGEKVIVDFLKYEHPRTKQFGVLGYVKLENLKEGMNRLEIKKVYDNSVNDKVWSIPFYYVAK